jgi:uncharacterized protein YjiS (DUF1127 family)
MIMSTIIGLTGTYQGAASDFLGRMAGALMHAWNTYRAWRIQEATIACLKSLSDRQLKDIGLTRTHIECAVRGALNARPDLARDW